MAKFSFFSFEWLSSKERAQQKEEQQLKLVELGMKEREMNKVSLPDKSELFQKEIVEQTRVEIPKPFRSVRLIGETCLVVLNDGTTLSKNDTNLLGQVRQSQSEEEIIHLFMTRHVPDQGDKLEKRKLVEENLDILSGNDDFEIRGKDVFLKGVNLAIPPVVLTSFIEVCEKIDMEVADAIELIDHYEALKMFWRWTALNPIESARESLLEFVQKNDITITTNGLLLMYRRVVKKERKGNHELVQFISNQYNKVKRWKKAPANYNVVQENSGEYLLRKESEGLVLGCQKMIGNLETLYLDLPNMQEETYTDAHTRTKDIRVGHVYKEDEDKIDLDRNQSCSSGLHVGSRSFGFGGFGDVGVVALVNPMYVRSVPNHASNKMRVSEMFIAAIAELDEYAELVEDAEILDFSNEYCSESLEEIEKMLEEKKIDKISCQDNLPAVSMVDVQKIKDALKERIVNI